MKYLYTILFCFCLNAVFAQNRVTIIDKTPETALLFDENNPQSLVSLFKSNELPFTPMNKTISDELIEKGLLKNAPYKSGPQSPVALANIDGEDSMAVFNGVLQFVYPEPDRFYTDLDNITRLLLYEHQIVENGETLIILDSIGYAKKYEENSQFIQVGTLPYNAINHQYQLFYIQEVKTEIFQQLMYGDFWNKLKENQLLENPIKTSPILDWSSIFDPEQYAFTFESLQQNRPARKWWSTRKYNWPISSDPVESYLSKLEKKFGEGNVIGFEGPQADLPLTNIDGEDSMVIDQGMFWFVYPEPEFFISWINAQPTKAFLIYNVSSESLAPKNELVRIVFTRKETNELLADFDCTDPRAKELYYKLLTDAGIQFQVPVQETWKTALLKAKKKAKSYSVDSKKLKKEIRM